jgi:hypothetical protein
MDVIVTMMVMGIFSVGTMIMGAMCIIIVNVVLQVTGRLTLLVEGTLAVGEAEGDEGI